MTSKISIYLIPILFSAILFFSFSTSGNSFAGEVKNESSINKINSPTSGAVANVLVLIHDTTTVSAKRKADRDTLYKYLPTVVGAYTLATFTAASALPDLTPYNFIILQETSFDASIALNAAARTQIIVWLNSGTALDKKRLLSIGADQAYNYSRAGSTFQDLVFSDTYGKYIYRLDNGSGSVLPSIIGVNIDIGNTRSMTSTPPGGGYYPDGVSMSAGGTALYRYQNHTAADTLAAIGNMSDPRYVVGTMFQDPRYFTDGFGIVFEQMVLWVNENTPLPVELSSFISTVSGNNVTLNWTTSSEINNAGFDVERSAVNGDWSKVGNVQGNGTSTSSKDYSFTDRALNSGKYNYRLKQIDFNGNFGYFNLSNEVGVGIPTKYDLAQNYPNPFNPSTKINYDIPFDGKVNVRILDISGREVATLVNDIQQAGYYTINFNASTLSSGAYFYTISAYGNGQNFVATKKMILVK